MPISALRSTTFASHWTFLQFLAWRLNAHLAFDISSGVYIHQVSQGDDADTRGDLYVFTRIMIQLFESFGLSLGAQLAVVGKSGSEGKLQTDAVYTLPVGALDVDVSIFLAYESRDYISVAIAGTGIGWFISRQNMT